MKKTLIFIIIYSTFWGKSLCQLIDTAKLDYTWDARVGEINFSQNKYAPSHYLIKYLDNIHNSSDIKPITFAHFNSKFNVNLEVKKKVISILKNEWSFDEIKTKWEYYKKNNSIKIEAEVNKIFISNYNPKIHNYNDYKNYLYDSLIKPFKAKFEQEIKEFKVPINIILAVAWIDEKEAIPILKEAYNTNSLNFDRRYLEIALAKFGNKIAFQNLIKGISSFPENWLCDKSLDYYYYIWALKFVGSQESIFFINTLLDTTEKCTYPIPDGPDETVYAATTVLENIYRIFKNPSFKIATKNFDFEYYYWKRKVTPELILNVKKWLIDNKGEYDINYEFLLPEVYGTQFTAFPKLW